MIKYSNKESELNELVDAYVNVFISLFFVVAVLRKTSSTGQS